MSKRTYDTPLFNNAKMNKHTYYCTNDNCTNETDYNGGLCNEHMESLSYESSECPGCGNDIYCGANGYCSNCWAERFGCESPISNDEDCGQSRWTEDCTCPPSLVDGHARRRAAEHVCSGEWDYARGIRVCDDEYCDFPPRPNSVISHHERSCASCHEHFTSKDQTRCCGECHVDAAVVIQKWLRNRRHERDVREAFAWCNLWFQGHCRSCKSYFPTQGEDDVHCPECRDSIKLPNLPPSPIDEIEEKLRQTSLSCDGCRDDILNQQGHMNPGGCLYIPCHECGNSNCCCSPSEAD